MEILVLRRSSRGMGGVDGRNPRQTETPLNRQPRSSDQPENSGSDRMFENFWTTMSVATFGWVPSATIKTTHWLALTVPKATQE